MRLGISYPQAYWAHTKPVKNYILLYFIYYYISFTTIFYLALSWNNDIEMLTKQTKNITFTLSQPVNSKVILYFDTSHEHSSKKNVSPVVYQRMVSLFTRGGVEDTRLEAKVTKKMQGQGQPF